MRARTTYLSVAALVCLRTLSACQFEHDSVASGYYGPLQAGTEAASATVNVSSTQAAVTEAGRGAAAAAPRAPAAVAAGASDAAGMQPQAGSTADSSKPAPGACDLSGRWLSTWHYTTDALGNLQTARSYIYLELEQQGELVTVKKGLQCGNDAESGGSLAVKVDFRASWAAGREKVNFQGRRGSSAKVASGCKVELEKWYVVQGATLPYYLDPSHPLPSAEQKASGSSPGWEDWDNDGQPGVTGTITGTVTGKVFSVPRVWTAVSGTVPDVASVFKVPMQWDQEANIVAVDGSPLLASEVARAADPALHFAQFARLTAEQAAGDDAAICKRVVELAPSLTPLAAAL